MNVGPDALVWAAGAKPGGSLLQDSRLPKLKTNSCLCPMRHRWSAISREAELRLAGQTGVCPTKKEKGPTIRSLRLWCAGLLI